jgi:cyclic beta-1,2-glucan synthetase
MYRLILESLLGISINIDKMTFNPCLPADWKEFKVSYLFQETTYQITVRQTEVQPGSVTIDGFERQDRTIHLANDHQEHLVEVKIPVASEDKIK